MPILLRGLTWDHTRATAPLRAAQQPMQQALPDVQVTWSTQPLAAFEARPIAEAAKAYDLVIFDHPHVGEVAAQGLLHPIDALLSELGLTDLDFIGPSLASYRYGGAVWGLPLDAACQVSCSRADLFEQLDIEIPRLWKEVLALGEAVLRRECRLAIAFRGVHSLMTLLSLCANQDAALADCADGPPFVDRRPAIEALYQMKELLRFCPAQALEWNSIEAQEAMCSRDDLVYCPAVYGFVTYAVRPPPRRLSYGPLPGIATAGRGSTLGGAGLGISAYCAYPEAALAVARFLIDERVQETIIAAQNGQPARTSAWSSVLIDDRSGNFYSQTRTTIQQAWIRPRFNGYLEFQQCGGLLVETYLRGAASISETLDALDAAWYRAATHDS